MINRPWITTALVVTRIISAVEVQRFVCLISIVGGMGGGGRAAALKFVPEAPGSSESRTIIIECAKVGYKLSITTHSLNL